MGWVSGRTLSVRCVMSYRELGCIIGKRSLQMAVDLPRLSWEQCPDRCLHLSLTH